MNNMVFEAGKSLSRHEVFELLFNMEDNSEEANLCEYADNTLNDKNIFDEFGNYSFPFDIKTPEPNIAIGYIEQM